METLKEMLAAKGVSRAALENMQVEQLKNLAKAFGIDPKPFMPRNVKIEVGKSGATYIVTDIYSVPAYKDGKPVPGKTSPTRNLYFRADALDQIIADLQAAKELLTKQ